MSNIGYHGGVDAPNLAQHHYEVFADGFNMSPPEVLPPWPSWASLGAEIRKCFEHVYEMGRHDQVIADAQPTVAVDFPPFLGEEFVNSYDSFSVDIDKQKRGYARITILVNGKRILSKRVRWPGNETSHE